MVKLPEGEVRNRTKDRCISITIRNSKGRIFLELVPEIILYRLDCILIVRPNLCDNFVRQIRLHQTIVFRHHLSNPFSAFTSAKLQIGVIE